MDFMCLDPSLIHSAQVSYNEDSDAVKVRFIADPSLNINETDFELCKNEDIDTKITSVLSDEIEPNFDIRSVFAYLVFQVMLSDLSEARERNHFFAFRMPNDYLAMAEQKAVEAIHGPAMPEENPPVPAADDETDEEYNS